MRVLKKSNAGFVLVFTLMLLLVVSSLVLASLAEQAQALKMSNNFKAMIFKEIQNSEH